MEHWAINPVGFAIYKGKYFKQIHYEADLSSKVVVTNYTGHMYYI
jgi:hypothetical protein